MRQIHWAVVLASALLPVVTRAQEGELKLSAQGASKLWVEGTSSVRDWKCDATTIEATVTGAGAAATASAKEVGAAAKHALLTIPVAQLDCYNGTMNEHMRKALKAKDHPTVVFRAANYELSRSNDTVSVTMNGSLTLGGVEKPVTIKANAKPGANETLVVSGTREIRMTEFGLKPPSLMLGTMKVDEKITVGFDIVLKN